jgi:hypothetical protein
MGKRIIRIRQQDLNTLTLAPWLGKELDVVTTQNASHHGRLLQAYANHLVLQDVNRKWYHFKKHTHVYAYANLREVTAITWAPY